MQKTINALSVCKESIINAYQRKTGLSRKKLADFMTAEKWIAAKEAVELGFADKIIGDVDKDTLTSNSLFSQREYMGKLVAKMRRTEPAQSDKEVNYTTL
jgi:ATP-dependent Clp protease protease subunit